MYSLVSCNQEIVQFCFIRKLVFSCCPFKLSVSLLSQSLAQCRFRIRIRLRYSSLSLLFQHFGMVLGYSLVAVTPIYWFHGSHSYFHVFLDLGRRVEDLG